jgi:hypothetical protein
MPTKDQMKQYFAERYEQRINAAKEFLGGKCVDCGTNNSLEFDHIDPSTKFKSVTSLTRHRERIFWDEVRKCVLRCKPCHKILSDEAKRVPHGGGVWGRNKCKCDLCRTTRNEYIRYYRQSNGR